ncbi:bifunctional 3-(3-hydroxy-phenyl)propionate/3-hydroxycinnamic acid hydroxylase [Amycolatopsis sp. NPDC051061]|uniref:bifunctional 3-(3-hydroxy-phenyl)propionate/3-hydroxycinnamic acid hydroxylase MhpA n=1 Tax=Amycolatopsis sp. NPDC051061 TaxID=3155042 RepID=UPI00343543FA
MAGDTDPECDADVLVVGYGPVGQLLSVLLAQRGWRVTVLERWPTAFRLPRAVGFDSEAARILASAGIGESLAECGEPARDYAWHNAAGQTLIAFTVAEEGHCGWPEATSAYQPVLEDALIAHGEELPDLTVLRGYEVTGLTDRGDHVRVVATEPDGKRTKLTARFAVGCDGANSIVRKRTGTTVTDLEFSHDWLVCDVRLNQEREFTPNNLQICDPARPRTAVSAGPGHRRYEFMRVSGEDPEAFGSEDNAWDLLSLFDIGRDDGVLDRLAVYTFRAQWARRWRAGRMFLAGDSAHLMPPFAGQGMTSGFRDSANLAWKLDLVLRGEAGSVLLDSYTLERASHVQHAVTMSVGLGKVVCVADPAAAADRDTAMLAARKRDINPAGGAGGRAVVKPLEVGVLHRAPDGSLTRNAGTPGPQWRVTRDGRTGLFDDVVGTGFTLLTRGDLVPGAEVRAQLDGLDTRYTHLLPADTAQHGPDQVVDTNGHYLKWLDELDADAVLIRPDFYVFGTATDPATLSALTADLHAQLG